MTKAANSVWKDCEICRDLPEGDWYDGFSSGKISAGFSRLEKLDMERFREKIVRYKNFEERLTIIGLRRCPLCHTFYLETGENDTQHYASYLMSIDRIEDDEAFRELSARRSKKAKEWLRDLRTTMVK